MVSEGVAAITGVDTRELVQYLREQGSSLGRITLADHDPVPYVNPMKTNLVAQVTTKKPFHVSALPGKAKANVALIDCGVEENIIRCLVKRGANVTVFPMITEFKMLLLNSTVFSYPMTGQQMPSYNFQRQGITK